nr:site-specific integrase [Hyphomonas sp. Mor2]
MPVTLNQLNARKVSSITKPGRHADGGGLYLNVRPSGSKSWLFLYRWQDRRPELGLGSYPTVSLLDARRRADEARSYLSELPPRDPRNIWKQEQLEREGQQPFGEFVEEFLQTILGDFKNAKHRQQWENTLTTYASNIWSKPVKEIDTNDVLRVLQPIWNTKRETAKRLRGRLERVLDAAKVRGRREGENPARWRGHLAAILPNQKQQVRHHTALPFEQVPEFYGALEANSAISAKCLQFLILTATRSSEAREARWEEFDFGQGMWAIPASRMKAGREHRIPLSEPAVEIAKLQAGLRQSEYVFPGTPARKPISEAALRNLITRMLGDKVATIHGFRSSFRDWAGESTDYPRDVAELALAHQVGNAVERAYRRGDALERRRPLMDDWAEFASQNSA